MERVTELVILMVAANEVTYPSVATLIGQKQQKPHQQPPKNAPCLGVFNLEHRHLLPIRLSRDRTRANHHYVIWFALNLYYL